MQWGPCPNPLLERKRRIKCPRKERESQSEFPLCSRPFLKERNQVQKGGEKPIWRWLSWARLLPVITCSIYTPPPPSPVAPGPIPHPHPPTNNTMPSKPPTSDTTSPHLLPPPYRGALKVQHLTGRAGHGVTAGSKGQRLRSGAGVTARGSN